MYNNPRLFFALFVTIITGLYWVFPEIMPYNKGFAFEGFVIYKPFAKDAYNSLFVEKMNSYSIQRILPYLLLNASFNIFGIDFSDSNMLWFFKIMHYVLLIMIIYVWDKLSSHLKLGLSGQWIGFISLIMNVSNLKFDFYLPFTYDKLAIFSGLVSMYLYYSNKKYFLLLNSILALIIWPTSIVFNLIMILVPCNIKVVVDKNKILGAAWSFFVAGALISLFIIVVYVKHIPELPGIAPTVHQLLPFSILIVCLYLLYTQYNLSVLVFPNTGKEILSKLKEILSIDFKWINALVVILAYYGLTRVLGDVTNAYLTPQRFAINFTYCALQRPGQFLIAHAVFFGVPVILFSVFRHRIIAVIAELGYGMVLMIIVVLIQAVNSETRQMANVLAMIVLPVAIAADSVKATPRAIWATFGISLLLSKTWLPFNLFDSQKYVSNNIFPMNDFEKMNYLVWPQQIFFMNMGPWMSNNSLIVQGLVIVIMYFILYKIWTKATMSDLVEYVGK
ncbi:hypothetical protein [Hymenobacter canadensis]|uniref:Uncharacterized protein n=1 Tax=Hymenobacter canadensis TaxID=2999067 RepID=A0ABY7LNE0_9BACT|nr:hypothetical protein [Hymenobacter canadensis]WBA41958.1 hypothetical protein O3303_19385 [Hymenobacter canadensis]